MPARKAPAWTSQEIAILRDVFPREGVNGAAEALADRSWTAINLMASKLGLRSPVVGDAPKPRLQGAQLEEAIRLREEENWSFARIGATFGVAEASACNAVLIALCPRKGFTPAQRDCHGRLTEEGLERVRLALRKGLKGVDIQLRLGVSASCVAEQRRRYDRDLKARGKAPLPPPGGGTAYSGVRVSRAKVTEVEALFMDGLGTGKIADRTGVSRTSCTRIRNRLIKKLKRKGECLPGCDGTGIRRVVIESAGAIPPSQIAALRTLLLNRVPVRRAAMMVALGGAMAYRIRDQLAAELADRGERLPRPILPGRVAMTAVDPNWPPNGPAEIYRFRAMLVALPFDDAKSAWIAERAEAARAEQEARRAEARRPKTFEEQLAAVAAGKLAIVPAFGRAHLQPRFTEEGRRSA